MLDVHRRHLAAIVADDVPLALKLTRIESVFGDYAEWLDTQIRPAFEYTRTIETGEVFLDWTFHQGVWCRGLYTVHVKRVEMCGAPLTLLSIRHCQGEMVRDWNTFLEMKERFIGKEKYAVEIYPCASELRDTTNTYHMLEWPFAVGFSVMRALADAP